MKPYQLPNLTLNGTLEQISFESYMHVNILPTAEIGDIVKCCGWRVAHPDGLSGGLNVSVLEFDTLYDEFNEFVPV